MELKTIGVDIPEGMNVIIDALVKSPNGITS